MKLLMRARALCVLLTITSITLWVGCGPEPEGDVNQGNSDANSTTPNTSSNNSPTSNNMTSSNSAASGASCEEVCQTFETLCGPVVDDCVSMCGPLFSQSERDCFVSQSTCEGLDQCEEPGGANTSTNTSTNSGSNQGSNNVVNGVPASEYYGQFVWDSNDGRYSDGASEFDSPGENNVFIVDLFLFEDGNANVFYIEGQGSVSLTETSVSIAEDEVGVRVDTSWQIQGTTLVVGDVLSCSGLELNDRPHLSCELKRALGSSEAVGERANIDLSVQGTPDDDEFSEYAYE